MRVQFRYEVVENTNGLIDRYEALQRTESEIARRMDTIRMEGWRKEEEDGAFLTRLAAVYFIWDPALHERLNRTAAGALEGNHDQPKARKAEPKEFWTGSLGYSNRPLPHFHSRHRNRSAKRSTWTLSLSLRAIFAVSSHL